MIWRYWTGPGEPEVQALDGQRLTHDDDLPSWFVEWMDGKMDQVCDIDRPRHRSNMVRWHLLHEHGGVWLDHDVTIRTSIPSGVWVASRLRLQIPNVCAVSLPQEHPLAWRMLHEIDHHPPSDLACPFVSGDALMRRFIEDYPDVGRSRVSDWGEHARSTSRLRVG